jgi:hypothetical protein
VEDGDEDWRDDDGDLRGRAMGSGDW